MTISANDRATSKGLPDAVFAAGQPVASSIGQAIAANAAGLYEGVYDTAAPGASTQTEDGHAHTGNGDGRSIPRQVFSACWALPIDTDGGTTTGATRYEFNPGSVGDLADWRSYTALYNAHIAPGWVQGFSSADTDRFNCIKAIPLRLRAGCKGIFVKLWRGTNIGADASSATTVIWRTELRTLTDGAVGDSETWDYAVETISADENAQWIDHPGARSGADVVGYASADLYLACTDPAGEALSADADFILYIGVKPSHDALTGGHEASAAYLYGCMVYEVPFES